jgi:hypothetical protein
MKKEFLSKYPNLRTDLKKILREAGFDKTTGCSAKYELTPKVIEKYYGNGDTLTRRGTVLRDFFVLRSYYRNGVERVDDPIRGHWFEKDGVKTLDRQSGGKYAIRLEGYGASTIPKANVPSGMAKKMVAAGIPARCVWSGSTSSLQVDHREGRPQKGGFTKSNVPEFYQFLTEHNNQVKRSACHHCVETGQRFNAQKILGTRLDFLEGDETFSIDGPGCRGCMLYDINKFFKSL